MKFFPHAAIAVSLDQRRVLTCHPSRVAGRARFAILTSEDDFGQWWATTSVFKSRAAAERAFSTFAPCHGDPRHDH